MIVKSFQNVAVIRGGLLFFKSDVAIKVIAALRIARIPILGIDGFRITEKETQPFMEHSVEFPITIQESWAKAEEFINSKKDLGLLFEIVADEWI